LSFSNLDKLISLQDGEVSIGKVMEKTIARLNIQHYRRLVSEETDENKKQTLFRLLAEEEAKLKGLLDGSGSKSKSAS